MSDDVNLTGFAIGCATVGFSLGLLLATIIFSFSEPHENALARDKCEAAGPTSSWTCRTARGVGEDGTTKLSRSCTCETP
jgi:hypothetical protein